MGAGLGSPPHPAAPQASQHIPGKEYRYTVSGGTASRARATTRPVACPGSPQAGGRGRSADRGVPRRQKQPPVVGARGATRARYSQNPITSSRESQERLIVSYKKSPPGFSTRAICAIAAGRSARCSSTSVHQTTSKLASAKGSASACPQVKTASGQPGPAGLAGRDVQRRLRQVQPHDLGAALHQTRRGQAPATPHIEHAPAHPVAHQRVKVGKSGGIHPRQQMQRTARSATNSRRRYRRSSGHSAPAPPFLGSCNTEAFTLLGPPPSSL